MVKDGLDACLFDSWLLAVCSLVELEATAWRYWNKWTRRNGDAAAKPWWRVIRNPKGQTCRLQVVRQTDWNAFKTSYCSIRCRPLGACSWVAELQEVPASVIPARRVVILAPIEYATLFCHWTHIHWSCSVHHECLSVLLQSNIKPRI